MFTITEAKFFAEFCEDQHDEIDARVGTIRSAEEREIQQAKMKVFLDLSAKLRAIEAAQRTAKVLSHH